MAIGYQAILGTITLYCFCRRQFCCISKAEISEEIYIQLREISRCMHLWKRESVIDPPLSKNESRTDRIGKISCLRIATIVHARTHLRMHVPRGSPGKRNGGGRVARITRPSPPPRPQGQRSSPAARSTLRIVCLQFIG